MKRQFKSFKDIVALAVEHKFVVTSTNGGTHNRNSKHYRGLAIDVRTRDKSNAEIDSFIKICREFGLRVLDERKRPDNQKVWNGAHLHIEIV